MTYYRYGDAKREILDARSMVERDAGHINEHSNLSRQKLAHLGPESTWIVRSAGHSKRTSILHFSQQQWHHGA